MKGLSFKGTADLRLLHHWIWRWDTLNGIFFKSIRMEAVIHGQRMLSALLPFPFI